MYEQGTWGSPASSQFWPTHTLGGKRKDRLLKELLFLHVWGLRITYNTSEGSEKKVYMTAATQASFLLLLFNYVRKIAVKAGVADRADIHQDRFLLHTVSHDVCFSNKIRWNRLKEPKDFTHRTECNQTGLIMPLKKTSSWSFKPNHLARQLYRNGFI